MAPAALLTLEVSAVAIFLGTPLTDPQLYMTLVFQIAYSFFKNTGTQMRAVEKVKVALGLPPSTEEGLEVKKNNLAVVATAHNTSQVIAPVVLLMILACEQLWRSTGFSLRGDMAEVMVPYYRETGMIVEWRNGVSATETALVIAIVIMTRVIATVVEEKLTASMNPDHRRVAARLIELLFKDGPPEYRALTAMMTLACLFVMPAELAFVGKELADARAASDDT